MNNKIYNSIQQFGQAASSGNAQPTQQQQPFSFASPTNNVAAQWPNPYNANNVVPPVQPQQQSPPTAQIFNNPNCTSQNQPLWRALPPQQNQSSPTPLQMQGALVPANTLQLSLSPQQMQGQFQQLCNYVSTMEQALKNCMLHQENQQLQMQLLQQKLPNTGTITACSLNGAPTTFPFPTNSQRNETPTLVHASSLAMDYLNPSIPAQFVPHANVRNDSGFYNNGGAFSWNRGQHGSIGLIPTKKYGAINLVDPSSRQSCRPALRSPQPVTSNPFFLSQNSCNTHRQCRNLPWRQGYFSYIDGLSPKVKYKLEDELNNNDANIYSTLEFEQARKWKKLDENAMHRNEPQQNQNQRQEQHISKPSPAVPPRLERVKYFDPYHLPPRNHLQGRSGPPVRSYMDDNQQDMYVSLWGECNNNKPMEIVANLPERITSPTSKPTPAERPNVPNSQGQRVNRVNVEKEVCDLAEKTMPVFFSSRRRPTSGEKADLSTSTQTTGEGKASNEGGMCRWLQELIESPTIQRLRGGPKIRQRVDKEENSNNSRLQSRETRNNCNISFEPENREDKIPAENEMQEVDMNTVPVKLSRPGYYCIPSLQDLRDMEYPKKGAYLKNFQIGHKTFGKVVFDGWTNVVGLDLDEIITFQEQTVLIYTNYRSKPAFGKGLHKPCTVTFHKVFPSGSHTNSSGRECVCRNTAGGVMGFEETLKKKCESINGRFLDYNPNNGDLIFRIYEYDRTELQQK